MYIIKTLNMRTFDGRFIFEIFQFIQYYGFSQGNFIGALTLL